MRHWFLLLAFALMTGAGPQRPMFAGNEPPRPAPDDGPARPASSDDGLAQVGARIVPSPSDPPLNGGVVLIRNGKIVEVGEHKKIKIPGGMKVLDCTGMTLLAGFWNSHVHFIEPKWAHADSLPAEQLTAQLQAMLTRYGYTHVFELATFHLENILALRKRIDRGEIPGPSIAIAAPFVPPHGNPFYIEPLRLPEMSDAKAAAEYAAREIGAGADAIKLWSSSPVGNGTVNMPLEMVSAAVTTAHHLGKPVFAHESTDSGLLIAMAGGVDILAHTEPWDRTAWTPGRIDSLITHRMALIPTLKLWTVELRKAGVSAENNPVMATALQQAGAFSRAGGEILFGTDVGYITDYSPEEEYRLLGAAGMSFEAILASLTTTPARRFGKEKQTGRVVAGMDADLVLLSADPKKDVRAFKDVVYTLRQGKIIYHKHE